MIEAMDAKRIEYITGLLLALGCERGEAEVRSFLIYSYIMGEGQIAREDTHAERAARVEPPPQPLDLPPHAQHQLVRRHRDEIRRMIIAGVGVHAAAAVGGVDAGRVDLMADALAARALCMAQRAAPSAKFGASEPCPLEGDSMNK